MSDFVAQEPQQAPKSLSDDQLHAALLDAYRHLADQAPRGSTLLLPTEHRSHRGQVAMVMAAAVAAIAIPTVVITQIARPGGSILPGGPVTVSTPAPAPFTGSLTTTPPATKTVYPTPMATVVQASPRGTATVVQASPPGTATVVRVSPPGTATLVVATTPAAASTESGSSTRTYSPMTGSDS